MATVFKECWKCDLCTHVWIKGEIWPSHCPSKLCRTRKWNSLSAGASSVIEATKLPTPTLIQTPTSAPESVKTSSPSSLLAIPGIMRGSDLGTPRQETVKANMPAVAPEPVTVPLCLHPWWEDSEQYQCLMPKHHKSPKHGQHGMYRNITE